MSHKPSYMYHTRVIRTYMYHTYLLIFMYDTSSVGGRTTGEKGGVTEYRWEGVQEGGSTRRDRGTEGGIEYRREEVQEGVQEGGREYRREGRRDGGKEGGRQKWGRG